MSAAESNPRTVRPWRSNMGSRCRTIAAAIALCVLLAATSIQAQQSVDHPDAVVTRLNRELGMILARPQIAARLADLGFFTYAPEPPPAVRARVRAQYELWGKLTRDIGLEPE